MKEIGNDALSGCSSLNIVHIGKSVEKIGDCVFQGCTSLARIVIPDSVKRIGAAFDGCPNLRLVCIRDEKVTDNTGLDSNVKKINPLARKEERMTWNDEERDLVEEYEFEYYLGPVGNSDTDAD